MTTVPAFEHDYQRKLMLQRFAAPTTLAAADDVRGWRQAWMAELKGWHSPYSVVVDCTRLTVTDDDGLRRALDLMVRFFQGLHLRKIVGFGSAQGQGHELLPFPVLPDESEALTAVGVRVRQERAPTDFRSTIRVENHFKQQVLELSFAEPVVIATKDQVATVRSKIVNNLAQWHSPWNLLVDCTNMTLAAEARPALELALRMFRGLHMKEAVGYSPPPGVERDSYPFVVYRARHKAAAMVAPEGAFSGDSAHCRSGR